MESGNSNQIFNYYIHILYVSDELMHHHFYLRLLFDFQNQPPFCKLTVKHKYIDLLNMSSISPKAKVDLHMHTNFSDGKFSPKTLINYAKKSGLSIVSITDHDNVNGLTEAIKYGSSVGVNVIPGVELSAFINDIEVHILGYFINHEDPALLKFLTALRYARINRLEKMIQKLNDMGSKIKMEEVVNDLSNDISIGRPHIAAALVKENFAASYGEAFYKYIGDGKPACVQKPVPHVSEVIKLISSIGGLSFIAHPGKTVRDELLSEIIKLGIDGIEVIHPSHSAEDIRYFSSIASEYYLLESGGSDFHGLYKKDFSNLGSYFISPNSIVNMRRRLL